MQIGKHVVNSQTVMWTKIEVMGSGTYMTIHFIDGSEITVRHWPYGFEPVNVYALERTLRGYMERSNAS